MCSSQQTVEAKHNKKILETMQKILKSSTNELGEGVEKRADWLLNDIRQMNTSTATLNGGSLLRSGQLVDSHLHNKKKNDRKLHTIGASFKDSKLRGCSFFKAD